MSYLQISEGASIIYLSWFEIYPKCSYNPEYILVCVCTFNQVEKLSIYSYLIKFLIHKGIMIINV